MPKSTDTGLRVGLVYKAKGMPSGPKQLEALAAAGVPEDAIWQDTSSRTTLENWFLSGRVVSSGDTVVVTTLHALGDTTRKQGAVRRKLESLGVTVELAATDEGPSRPRGRPPKHVWPEDTDRFLRKLWKDRNVPRKTFFAQAKMEFAERGLGPVPHVSVFKRRYGPRGGK